jgi:catalase
VDGLNRVFGVHRARAAHAKGICCVGTFTATPYVSRLTRAAHMAGGKVPVTVRFSNGAGAPAVRDDAAVASGMAVKFALPSGESTDLLTITAEIFPARTPEDFLELLDALATGKPEALAAFKKAHPELRAALEFDVKPLASYAQAEYHAVHAFRFINAQGQECFVRYSWRPKAGIATLSKAEAARRPADYLQSELRHRLASGGAEFTLHLKLAAAGDDVNDPATAWPEDRPYVFAGTLTLTDLVADQTSGCEALVFDPTRLTDGIAASADPILHGRSGAYFLSHKRRTAT